MMSSNMKRLNILIVHFLGSWMDKSGTIGSWSRDTVLVSNKITNIDKIIKWKKIVTNIFLLSRWGISII